MAAFCLGSQSHTEHRQTGTRWRNAARLDRQSQAALSRSNTLLIESLALSPVSSLFQPQIRLMVCALDALRFTLACSADTVTSVCSFLLLPTQPPPPQFPLPTPIAPLNFSTSCQRVGYIPLKRQHALTILLDKGVQIDA